jgi:mannose-6-phosphate isomerase
MMAGQDPLTQPRELTPVVPLLPNRVRRNYRGGYFLDKLEGRLSPQDGNRPEDWLASTVAAINPGMEPVPDEGLSRVQMNSSATCLMRDLFEMAPDYYLGPAHARRHGGQLGFLAKLLDSSMRLPLQAHPTTAFAREHLRSSWGKLEAYVILGLRDENNAFIRLGFQRPPKPSEWRRIVLEQDIAAMDACFDSIPVRPGEVWLVPGGLPHAIGEGVFMLEVMEPSDLVVRCEFERDGLIVPPEARFMQTSPDLALQIFDYTPWPAERVRETYCLAPQPLNANEHLLVGPAQTECFSVTRLVTHDATNLPTAGHARLGCVARGEGTLAVSGQEIPLTEGSRFLLAASAPGARITPHAPELEILFCSPGAKA